MAFSIGEDHLKFFHKPGLWDSEAGAFLVFIGTDSRTEHSAPFWLKNREHQKILGRQGAAENHENRIDPYGYIKQKIFKIL